jgi:hypothetical protein
LFGRFQCMMINCLGYSDPLQNAVWQILMDHWKIIWFLTVVKGLCPIHMIHLSQKCRCLIG